MSWGKARGLFAEERGPIPAHSLESSRSETLDSLRLISVLKNPLEYCTFEQYITCHRHAACACAHLTPHGEGAESDDTGELRALAGRTLCRAAG
jgi:hypothetical protein